MKRLLNSQEELVNVRLKRHLSTWGAHAFVKIRLADVFPIKRSGISQEQYRFALQAHFDFLITDDNLLPLFAVEFDGPHHNDSTQQNRDATKNSLCKKFRFPLLRVNARYLSPLRGGLDLLGWFVHAWFLQETLFEAQERGDFPLDEPVLPTSTLWFSGSNKLEPLYLSLDIRAHLEREARENPGQDPIPSCLIGEDKLGNLHAIAWLKLPNASGIFVKTGMRQQFFHVPISEVLEDLAVMELYEALKEIKNGVNNAVSIVELKNEIDRFRNQHTELRGCELS